MKYNFFVRRDAQGELGMDAGVSFGRLEGGHAPMADNSYVGEVGTNEGFGHIVVVDDEGSFRSEALHGAEFCGACCEMAFGVGEEAPISMGMDVGIPAKRKDAVGYFVDTAENDFVVPADSHKSFDVEETEKEYDTVEKRPSRSESKETR